MQQEIINMNIDAEKWYKPSEIVSLGLIVNFKGVPDKWFVYRLIKTGKLPYRNACLQPNKRYFQVKGSDIIEYLKQDQRITE